MHASLTGAIRSAKKLTVQRILSFLIGLALLASLGLGAVAHANEPVCSPGVEAPVSAGHVDGDADQVPADSGKAYPHHHGGCHGHHVATPLDRASQGLRLSVAAKPIGGTTIEVATATTDPALRPPIA
ncbi:hypothetical protein ASE86_07625 [Sphingomonas sp. Leaf33]|uniref:hypothetical protein n=1 Tax=Sphingomonas sp. Leaf33 TaxID=1736215 RepID=UPI0006F90554|nr:hypothetical protein [Sphingomonas sp. Leaf33]KQN26027.1 hypothetical protein ASE86_07625 [Sphingomonas sp. Leaf33]